MKLKRLTFLAVCGWASLVAEAASVAKPNIVFLLCDDLGYGDVKCNNPDGKIATPNIDRLGAAGMRFTDAHTTSSVCTPTRYSLLTGRYNWRSRLQRGVLGGLSPRLIEPGRLTVADAAQAERLPHRGHRQMAPRHGLGAKGGQTGARTQRHRKREPGLERRFHQTDPRRSESVSASTTTSASPPRWTWSPTPSSRTTR